MSTTEEALDKAVEGLDDKLEKVDAPNAATDEGKPADPTIEPEEPEKAKNPKEDEGYTADELEPDEDAPTVPEKQELDQNTLGPELKYVFDRLPHMTARIKDGSGGVKELRVKSPAELPEDFEFATKRDELLFQNAQTAQEIRATNLQSEYKQQELSAQGKEFMRREDEATREDIGKLQKSGALPKFKTSPDDPKFADDPSTKEVQTVLSYMNDRNNLYQKMYEQGRPARRIGFEEAFYMYRYEHPAEKQVQGKEDAERREMANKVGGNRGLSTSQIKKPLIHSGTRTQDILARLDAEEW